MIKTSGSELWQRIAGTAWGRARSLRGSMATAHGQRVCSVVTTNGQWMSLRVEHPLVQWDELVVGEYQVQIFECFRQEEALLSIVFARWKFVDIADARIARASATILVQCLRGIPRVLPVLGILGQSPHDKVTFNHFGPGKDLKR